MEIFPLDDFRRMARTSVLSPAHRRDPQDRITPQSSATRQ
jgi:hypothetical protein